MIVNRDLSASRLIQYAYLNSVPERRLAVSDDIRHVFQIRATSDNVISYVVTNVLYHTIVAHYHIMKSGVEDSAMLLDSTCQSKNLPEGSELNLA